MADHFDSNVAKRKPNVRSRPAHPWDVPSGFDDAETVSVDDGSSSPDDAVSGAELLSTPATDSGPDTIVDVDALALESGNIVAPDRSNPEERVASIDTRDVIIPDRVGTVSKRKRSSNAVARVSRRSPSDVNTSPTPEAVSLKSQSHAGGLSDAINIHSNFCKLDNDVSDRLLCHLSASAQAVYIRLYRQSFGWNRNWAAESLPKLSKSCNLSLQTIRKAIKELETIGSIRKEFSDYHKATVYRVFLPSEISLSETGSPYIGPLISNIPFNRDTILAVHDSAGEDTEDHIPPGTNSVASGVDFRRGDRVNSGGQDFVIQSAYFAGTSIYKLLEAGGSLPKNILTYITDIHLREAVDTIDSFYDSCGFPVVSRALYRKSVFDYIDLIRSGFSPDDIRYAVRWTFQNSRSRPESFSLIKHTMHLAMKDMIEELTRVSGQTDKAREKQAAVERTLSWEKVGQEGVSAKEENRWRQVKGVLESELTPHSYRAFIEPLKLIVSGKGSVTFAAPPDFASWVNDHYRDRIAAVWQEQSGEAVKVTIE